MMETQKKYDRVYSCEFFPPKTDQGMDKLLQTCGILKQALNPSYFSVTYGAGGSTQERTFSTVNTIQQSAQIEVAPHLSCVGSTRQQINSILQNYMEQGIQRIVALRGDMPSGMVSPGDFEYANELISFIREETGDHFHIEVAAYPEFHPQASSALRDLENFKRKVEAGANTAITQYFYNIDAYLNFVDSCEKLGLDLPIVPGIMPISNYASLSRFSNVCGAEIPRWVRRRLEDLIDDPEALRDFGTEVVSRLCQQLLDQGAPGLHFYTLNQAEPTLKIWRNLSI